MVKRPVKIADKNFYETAKKANWTTSGDGCGPSLFGRRSDPAISTGTFSTAGPVSVEPRTRPGADGARGIGATPRG